MLIRASKQGGLKSYLFSSFFAAAMIAATYAYFNYKFSRYHFIDFGQIIFYTQNDIFEPKDDEYLMIFYSSKSTSLDLSLDSVQGNNLPILAIDFSQDKRETNATHTIITAGMNTLLTVIHRFNIKELPSALIIKKQNKNIYKQDSLITKI